MSRMPYLDFDVQIQRVGDGYRAQVLTSPAGQASRDFGLPFAPLEIENFLLRVSRTRRAARRIDSPEMEAAKIFGGRLFDAVFGGEVRSALRSSLTEANRQDGCGSGYASQRPPNSPICRGSIYTIPSVTVSLYFPSRPRSCAI